MLNWNLRSQLHWAKKTAFIIIKLHLYNINKFYQQKKLLILYLNILSQRKIFYSAHSDSNQEKKYIRV